MASSAPAKRPLDSNGDDSAAKRLRSINGSPAPVPSSHEMASQSDLERKKAEAAERMAAIKAKLAASKTNGVPPAPPPPHAPPPPSVAPLAAAPPPTNDLDAKRADAARRIAEMKAKMAKRPQGTVTTATASAVNVAPVPPPPLSDVQQRMAEARARAEEIAKQRSTTPSVPAMPPPRQDSGKAARGGLHIGLHPSLLGDGGAAAAKGKTAHTTGPKFSTTKGNHAQPETPALNPYLATSIDNENDTAKHEQDETYDATLAARQSRSGLGERKSKQLIFNQKGKFMAQANALRQQARLEELKKRIAAETRKTEIEEASDKAFLVPPPPEVEWWDENLVNKNIDSTEEGGGDSIITNLIQHPVILQAPQDKLQPAPKPLMLTPTEQKKLRRQRRMADMKEEQAKIRLGLIEPPPPKVKKSNMMRVFGEQAVQDPTAVEARVNREIAARAHEHEKANRDRQLTKEERAEKLKKQQELDASKGVKVAVFRVGNLSSGKHRYQVDVNAKQNALTGMVVLHPEMNLVIVEGGTHSINFYKKLMLNRIKWEENTLPLLPPSTNNNANSNNNNNNNTSSGAPAPSTFLGANDGTKKSAGGAGSAAGSGGEGESKAARWLNPFDEHGDLKDLSENGCQLVWEGEVAQRAFKRWGSKACETDGEARDVLTRNRMENMWTLARSMG